MTDVLSFVQMALDGPGLPFADWMPINGHRHLICQKGNIGIFFCGERFRYIDGTNGVPSEKEIEAIYGDNSFEVYERAYHIMSKGHYYVDGVLHSLWEERGEASSQISPEEMDDKWSKLPKFISFART